MCGLLMKLRGIDLNFGGRVVFKCCILGVSLVNYVLLEFLIILFLTDLFFMLKNLKPIQFQERSMQDNEPVKGIFSCISPKSPTSWPPMGDYSFLAYLV
jgi:hypothetical protein